MPVIDQLLPNSRQSLRILGEFDGRIFVLPWIRRDQLRDSRWLPVRYWPSGLQMIAPRKSALAGRPTRHRSRVVPAVVGPGIQKKIHRAKSSQILFPLEALAEHYTVRGSRRCALRRSANFVRWSALSVQMKSVLSGTRRKIRIQVSKVAGCTLYSVLKQQNTKPCGGRPSSSRVNCRSLISRFEFTW